MVRNLKLYEEFYSETIIEEEFISFLGNLPTVKNVEIKSRNSKTMVLYVKSTSRNELKESFKEHLEGTEYSFLSEKISSRSSVSASVVNLPHMKSEVFFKPVSGGMNEVTLNAAITELFPCIAFLDKFPRNITDPKEFYKMILNSSQKGCYLSKADRDSGDNFIIQAQYSTKLDEKLLNAIAIYEYICETDKNNSITNVFWTAKTKPSGVNAKHAGDIFIQFKNKNYVGISLKAGSRFSTEPQLNTYMKPILEFFNYNIDSVRKELWNITYKHLDLPENYDDRKEVTKTRAILAELENTDPKLYNEYYDKNLKYLRKLLIDIFMKDQDKFIKYIKENITREFANTPTILLKAMGTNWEELGGIDKLAIDLQSVEKIKVKVPSGDKQKFYFHLDKTGIMDFSVRTNRVGSYRKLGQFFNLAVKYNKYIDT